MLMVQGKRNYPLPLQPHPQNQKQNQPKTYIGFGTANGGTSSGRCCLYCEFRRSRYAAVTRFATSTNIQCAEIPMNLGLVSAVGIESA
jgi:hypothetical protein